MNKSHLELHYVLSIIAIVLVMILLIITMVETEHNSVKLMFEIFAHMITLYVSYDLIKQYCVCDKND